MEKKNTQSLLLILVLLITGSKSASAAGPFTAKFVSGLASNLATSVIKRLWSLAPTQKIGKTVVAAVTGSRPMMKFESGYTVETVFDGSKLGIEPYSIEVTPAGELLVLDSINSNIYRISLPLSRYSRPKLVAGSAEGYAGHVDGRSREARLNHPKGLTMDDRGNIYVADTMNMAIRKISDGGVTTIAGGKWNRGGHIDGPSEDAKFSNDFEVIYITSSCSLLVVDRGSQAIREIQLHFDDCVYKYGSGFPLGLAVLLASAFFGYMLALLQRRLGAIISSKGEPINPTRTNTPAPYQKPNKSVRLPLIPPEHEQEKQEDDAGLVASTAKFTSGGRFPITTILGSMFSGFRRKLQQNHQYHQTYQRSPSMWPSPIQQESYVIRDEDEPPPPLETRAPTPRKTYAFMSKDSEKIHHVRHHRPYFNSWDGELQNHHNHRPGQQLQQQQKTYQQLVQQHRQYSSGPRTYYEQSCETPNEIVFGAVQEMDNKRKMVEIKAVNYGDPYNEQYCLGTRSTYMDSYNHYY